MDTRDIAIRAEESAASAHKRLNTINGQIGRLADAQEAAAVGVGKLTVYAKIGGFIAGAILTGIVTALVLLFTHGGAYHPQQAQQQDRQGIVAAP